MHQRTSRKITMGLSFLLTAVAFGSVSVCLLGLGLFHVAVLIYKVLKGFHQNNNHPLLQLESLIYECTGILKSRISLKI